MNSSYLLTPCVVKPGTAFYIVIYLHWNLIDNPLSLPHDWSKKMLSYSK